MAASLRPHRLRIGALLSGRRRRAWLAGLLVLAVLAVLDRMGVFGRTGDDFTRYDNRTFRVAHVKDGDTLDLAVPDGSHAVTSVRLWGVDTPETVRPNQGKPDYFGPEASTRTKALADGATVRIELVPNARPRDKYDRLLAYVYLPDGSMLNERLLSEGLAYADLRFDHPRSHRFRQLEDRARKAKLGLWAGVRPTQWPQWRQQMLGDSDEDSAAALDTAGVR